jgi:hypothetical protein
MRQHLVRLGARLQGKGQRPTAKGGPSASFNHGCGQPDLEAGRARTLATSCRTLSVADCADVESLIASSVLSLTRSRGFESLVVKGARRRAAGGACRSQTDVPGLGVADDLVDDRRSVVERFAKLDGRERRELLAELCAGPPDDERVALVDRDLAGAGKGKVGRPSDADWERRKGRPGGGGGEGCRGQTRRRVAANARCEQTHSTRTPGRRRRQTCA